MTFRNYIRNCFLLLIPILLWNIVLTKYLPEAFSRDVFWKDIPNWVAIGENVFRMAVMIMPVVMVLSIQTTYQKIGFTVYLVGTVLYFLSWIALIQYPNSLWGQSMLGFMAPALTPIIWLTGIGFIGNTSFFKIKHPTVVYILLSILFIFFHASHAYIVYQRL